MGWWWFWKTVPTKPVVVQATHTHRVSPALIQDIRKSLRQTPAATPRTSEHFCPFVSPGLLQDQRVRLKSTPSANDRHTA